MSQRVCISACAEKAKLGINHGLCDVCSEPPDPPSAPQSPIDRLGELLAEAGATIQFGLRQQGHIPTVERMLHEHKTWEDIGRAIGWQGNAAAEWYWRYEKPVDPPSAPGHAQAFRDANRGWVEATKRAEQAERALAEAQQTIADLRAQIATLPPRFQQVMADVPAQHR